MHYIDSCLHTILSSKFIDVKSSKAVTDDYNLLDIITLRLLADCIYFHYGYQEFLYWQD